MCKIKDTIIEKQDTGLDTYGKKTEICAVCKGRGVVYVSDNQGDVVGEICDCQNQND